MKRKQILMLMLAMISLGFTACKTSPKELLSRKWKGTDISSATINAEMKASLLAEENLIEFTQDGKYTAWSKGKMDDQGTYNLSADGKLLTTTSTTGGKKETLTITVLTKDKLVGELPGQTATITFEPSK